MQSQAKEEYIAFLDKRIALLESRLAERSRLLAEYDERLARLDNRIHECHRWLNSITKLMMEHGWNLAQVSQLVGEDITELERINNNKE